MKFFRNILDWFRYRHMWVIADASDNSITLSKALFHHMGGLDMEQAKVLVIKVAPGDPSDMAHHYAFTLNPSLEQDDAPLADIQYNSKYKSIGFEALSPTVNRIFYDYSLPALIKVKLTVKPRNSKDITYYEICPPR